MRGRIQRAIVAVSALIVILLGVPLAVVAHTAILNDEVTSMQRDATSALAEIAVPIDRAQLARVRDELDAPPPFAVYDDTGRRVFGVGPTADGLVARALRGKAMRSVGGGEIAIALPITDRQAQESVVGVVRVSESASVVTQRSALAWALMAASGALAIGLASIVGSRLARRLSRPLTDLATSAEQIGRTDLPVLGASGVAEIDRLHDVLHESADRVQEALARERALSADVSHQLRTPLTAARLHVEAATTDPSKLKSALTELSRLEATVDHLLAVARDATPESGDVRLDLVVREAVRRWQPRADADERELVTSIEATPATNGSPATLAQIIDVLIENALHHGAGTISITVRRLAGGAAIDVADEGDSMQIADAGRIFERGHGDGTGIGLALARSLAQAEGGRLIISKFAPTTFSVVLVAS